MKIAKVVKGELYKHLKDIELLGEERDYLNGFAIYCSTFEDEEKFLKAILEKDKYDGLIGLESIEQVKEWWSDGCGDMILVIEKGDYEIIR